MLNRIGQIFAPQDNSNKGPIQSPLKFQSGQIIRGRVIQKLDNGQILVSSKGRQFVAVTELGLDEGDKYRFQVKSAGPRIELKVLDGEFIKARSPIHAWASTRKARHELGNILRDLSSVNQLKGLAPDLKMAFKTLNDLLPLMLYNKPGENDVQWLTRYFMGSGLFWENKVAQYFIGNKEKSWKKLLGTDLKGILKKIEESLKSGGQDKEGLKIMAMKVKQALQIIEQNQLLNLSSNRDGIGYFLFVPGLEDEGFKQAEVFVKKDEEGDKKLYFSLLLDFTMLGQMEVAVMVVDSVINVKVYAGDEDKTQFIREHLHLLETGLERIGMTPGTIMCGTKEKGDIEMTTFSEGESAAPSLHVVI